MQQQKQKNRANEEKALPFRGIQLSLEKMGRISRSRIRMEVGRGSRWKNPHGCGSWQSKVAGRNAFRLASVLDTREEGQLERMGNWYWKLPKWGSKRKESRFAFFSGKPFLKVQPRSHHWNAIHFGRALAGCTLLWRSYAAYSLCSPNSPAPFTCKSQICNLGGYLLLSNEHTLPEEIWKPWRPWVLKQSLSRSIALPLEMFPSPVGLRAAMCWCPGMGRASTISLFFLDPPATKLHFVFYSLMTWSFFRSIQSQNNMSTWVLW